MTENLSRKNLTKVCTLDRDEMTPDEKHIAFLAALYENRDHEPLTTTDIRRATGLSNKDVQYEREKFVELGYIEVTRPDESDESGRPASYQYWLESDGKKSLVKYEYGDPADIRQETPYDLAQNALDGVKQAENRLRLELASNKRVSELEDELDDLQNQIATLEESMSQQSKFRRAMYSRVETLTRLFEQQGIDFEAELEKTQNEN
ncbi:hypothetical protein [Haloarcula brevis]|uniref:hypothetical protein n=1 Tax=Haloarcula brevis TaxID=3111453 RepID=UPI00300F066E